MVTIEELEAVLNQDVRPTLQAHGGEIELVSITEEGVVKVRLLGQCSTCPSAYITTEEVVAEALKTAFSEIVSVVLVTGVSESLMADARALLKLRTHQS